MGARGRKGPHETFQAPVRLVEPLELELPAAPRHLSEAMQSWWRQTVEAYELDAHHLRLLEAACDCWDRMVEARETLREEGLTVTTQNGGTRKHPCADIERDSRLAFARLVRELDLDCPEPRPGAYMPPPSLRSNRRR